MHVRHTAEVHVGPEPPRELHATSNRFAQVSKYFTVLLVQVTSKNTLCSLVQVLSAGPSESPYAVDILDTV